MVFVWGDAYNRSDAVNNKKLHFDKLKNFDFKADTDEQCTWWGEKYMPKAYI